MLRPPGAPEAITRKAERLAGAKPAFKPSSSALPLLHTMDDPDDHRKGYILRDVVGSNGISIMGETGIVGEMREVIQDALSAALDAPKSGTDPNETARKRFEEKWEPTLVALYNDPKASAELLIESGVTVCESTIMQVRREALFLWSLLTGINFSDCTQAEAPGLSSSYEPVAAPSSDGVIRMKGRDESERIASHQYLTGTYEATIAALREMLAQK